MEIKLFNKNEYLKKTSGEEIIYKELSIPKNMIECVFDIEINEGSRLKIFQDMTLKSVVNKGINSYALFEGESADPDNKGYILTTTIKITAKSVSTREVKILSKKGVPLYDVLLRDVYNKTGYIFDADKLRPGNYFVLLKNGNFDTFTVRNVEALKLTISRIILKENDEYETVDEILTIDNFFYNIDSLIGTDPSEGEHNE